MSFAISLGGVGKHSPANAELRARRAEADNQQLIADNEQLKDEVHTALIRGCQDAVRIAHLREQLAAAVAGIRETQRSLIRAKAEQERLRQAVVNARPRIREVPTDLVRPYSPVVCLPYVSPVDSDAEDDPDAAPNPPYDLPEGDWR